MNTPLPPIYLDLRRRSLARDPQIGHYPTATKNLGRESIDSVSVPQ